MTAIIAIIVKERKGKPFILVGSDSKRSHTDKPNDGVSLSETEEDADKVFRKDNKFLAISGSFRPSFQLELVKEFKQNSKKNQK